MMTFLKDQKQHKDIITFSFNKNEYGEISWENEREFEYKNEMYDVIDKKKEDDRMVIRCISDEKETALLNDYQKTNRQNHSNQYVLQLLTAAFILPENDLIKPSQKFVKKVFENYAPSLPSLAFSVLLPPPDVC